ncbi:MAG: GDP-L-fucose synthase [Candidatus Omnitrophica bacterium]|nr:GDP-L-fucose synthase [Candidatus Omnitrophota bacterium]MBU1127550.1 GDP-L-fucose synthase [Candidatus Omnitrophota bacterium]MBU1852386.1 GDP-L-fucose synthase [Candidatus Omnitrophota bacterium]
MSFWKEKNILITGGEGFLGKHLIRKLIEEKEVPKQNINVPAEKDCDLRIWENCRKAVKGMDIVIHLAAKVGGIGFNRKYPAQLFYDNAIMGIQMMEAARREAVKKYVALGTVCAYPKFTPVPFREEDIWNGYPEETNAPYGIAKKMQLVQSQSYRQEYGFNSIFLLPVNLYGPGDNFDLENSHVIPALIRKFLEAKKNNEKKVVVWGTGESSREFLYVEDAAVAILLATEKYNSSEPVNLGVGSEIKIKDLVSMIKAMTKYSGVVEWDKSRPDGQPRRMLDASKAEEEFGFTAKTFFETGLKKTIDWYIKCE